MIMKLVTLLGIFFKNCYNDLYTYSLLQCREDLPFKLLEYFQCHWIHSPIAEVDSS